MHPQHQGEQKVTLKIDGMSCNSCAKGIEKALKAIDEVKTANVYYATGKATVITQDLADHDRLTEAVYRAGYKATIIKDGNNESFHMHQDTSEGQAFNIFIFAAIFTLPFIIQMFSMLTHTPQPINPWAQWLFATLVQFGAGWIFYRTSTYGLLQGTANMDLLIALGTSAAYALSVYNLLYGDTHQLYFESSAVIITLVLLGRWLETKSKKIANEAIHKLVSIQPKVATVIKNGKPEQTPLEDVIPGNILLVKAGDTIPVDATVIEGGAEVNEAMITGESVPKVKRTGDLVLAGTININGSLRIQAKGVGANTVLAGMIRLVEKTQESKAPVQRFADKVSGIFVPCVMGIALATFAFWLMYSSDLEKALINAVSVLVIACPCSLGLATPIVVLAASGRGAQLGILFKDAAAIESTHKIGLLCFDKTGTLTEGKPVLNSIIAAAGYTENDVLSIAAGLESKVQHPLAKAIVIEAHERRLSIPDIHKFKTYPGKGALGTLDEQPVGIGAIHYAVAEGVNVDTALAVAFEKQGQTVICVWIEKNAIGYLAASDRLRDDAWKAVSALKEMSIGVAMLTGDHQLTAEAIAEQAGITAIRSGMLPQDKLNYIHQEQSKGTIVGMVGDGINDAPALTAADVGIALGASTDVAMETASVAIIQNKLLDIPKVISLSKAAFSKIKQNLFFAFIYNIIGIPLAALGILNPMFAAAAMALSSLSVVGNALLLRNWEWQEKRKL